MRAILFIMMMFLVSCDGRNSLWGDHSLGGNLSLLEGDRKEDRIVVYCSGRSGGACKSGIPVVPVYSRQFDEKGNYAEYVETAVANKKWIIARTLRIKENQQNYWIISKNFSLEEADCGKVNCDSILQSHVTGPLNLEEFVKKRRELNIQLVSTTRTFTSLLFALSIAGGVLAKTPGRRIYLSSQKEGLIGVTVASPTDNPAENLFRVYLSRCEILSIARLKTDLLGKDIGHLPV